MSRAFTEADAEVGKRFLLESRFDDVDAEDVTVTEVLGDGAKWIHFKFTKTEVPVGAFDRDTLKVIMEVTS